MKSTFKRGFALALTLAMVLGLFAVGFDNAAPAKAVTTSVVTEIVNGDFETGNFWASNPTGWTGLSLDMTTEKVSNIWKVENEDAYGGTGKSVHLAAGGQHIESSPIFVVAGETYKASLMENHVVGTNAWRRMHIKFYDADGNQIGEAATQMVFDTTNDGNWVERSMTAVAPAGAVTARMGYGVNNGETYIDNATFGHAAHDFKEVQDAQFLKTAGDCTTPAEYYKSCVCGVVDTATFFVAAAHTPEDAVIENVTAETYDEVVYCSVCDAEVSRTEKANQIINGDFEANNFWASNPTGWTSDNTAKTYRNNGEASYGGAGNSLRLDGGFIHVSSSYVYVVPGETYEASVMTSYISGGAYRHVCLKFFDAEGNEVGTYTKNTADQTAGWSELAVEAEAPAGAVKAQLELCINGSPSNIYFDNAAIDKVTPAVHTHTLTAVPAEPATTEKEGNIAYWTCECGKWFSDAEGTTEITDKSSVIIDKLPPVSSGDTFNGDFETGNFYQSNPTGWTCYLSGTPNTSKLFKAEGANAYGGTGKSVWLSNANVALVSSRVDVVPGATYEASVYAKRLSTGGASTYRHVKLRFFDANGTKIGADLTAILNDATDYDQWVKMSVSAVAPEGAAKAEMEFAINGTMDVYFDNAAIEELTPAVHTHTLTAVPAEPATTEKEGNIAYWTCECGKWFSDAEGTTEITDKSSVIIDKLPPVSSGDTFNGDFETGNFYQSNPTGWTGTNLDFTADSTSKIFKVEGEGAYGGTGKSVWLSNASMYLSSSTITVTPGKSYEASVMEYYKSGSSSVWRRVFIKFFDANGNQIGEAIGLHHTDTTQKDTWVKRSTTAVAPEGAVTAQMGFGINGTMDVYFDNAALVQVENTHVHTLTAVPAEPATTEKEGNKAYWTCECGKWFSDAEGTTEITDKNSVIIEKLPAAGGDDTTDDFNGDFETGNFYQSNPDGWTATNTAKVFKVTGENAYGGSGTSVWLSNAYCFLVSSRVDVVAGETYVASVMEYYKSTSTSTYRHVKLRFFDADGNIIDINGDGKRDNDDAVGAPITANTTPDCWIERYVVATAPAGAVEAEMEFGINGTMDVYFDNASITCISDSDDNTNDDDTTNDDSTTDDEEEDDEPSKTGDINLFALVALLVMSGAALVITKAKFHF